MKLLIRHRTAALLLGLLASTTAAAQDTPPEANAPQCVHVTQFYSQISAESERWQRSLLDALSDPLDACETLKLGLLLSHPVVAFQNDARGLDALGQAFIKLPEHAVDKAELAMLMDHIEERQALRNMLGATQNTLNRRNRQLKLRQHHIDTLRGQIDQLKNLEAKLEDKARELIDVEPALPSGVEPAAIVPEDNPRPAPAEPTPPAAPNE